MFERAELKRNAKKALKHFYLLGLAAAFIYAVLSGELGQMWNGFRITLNGFDEISYRGQSYVQQFLSFTNNHHNHYYIAPIGILTILLSGIFVVIRWLVGILYDVFIVNVVEVGLDSFFLKNRYEETNLGEMIAPFQNNYKNVVKVTFFRKLYTWLWSLLFIIPGVIKHYEYYFVPYLMAENPDLTSEEAFAKSRIMTNGEKLNIFIFDLSFIGWLILASFLGGVGRILVLPYVYASRSELYVCLKERKL